MNNNSENNFDQQDPQPDRQRGKSDQPEDFFNNLFNDLGKDFKAEDFIESLRSRFNTPPTSTRGFGGDFLSARDFLRDLSTAAGRQAGSTFNSPEAESEFGSESGSKSAPAGRPGGHPRGRINDAEHHHEERGEHRGDHKGGRGRGHGRGDFRADRGFSEGPFGDPSFEPAGPGRPGGFGPGRGRFGRGGRVRKGNVRSAILSLLSQGNYNGYSIIGAIDAHTDGAWRPSPGSIYPALGALQAEGLILTVGEGKRSEFMLTEAGKDFVRENAEQLANVWAEVGEEAQVSRDLRQSVEKLMGAVGQLTANGSEQQLKDASQAIDSARKAIYTLLAE